MTPALLTLLLCAAPPTGQAPPAAQPRYAAVTQLRPGDTLFESAWFIPEGPGGLEVVAVRPRTPELFEVTVRLGGGERVIGYRPDAFVRYLPRPEN